MKPYYEDDLITPETLRLIESLTAREWASAVRYYVDTYSREALAAAKVIQSLPDEDRVLPMVEKLEEFAKRINALLPDPAPRTLAELIEAGHAPEEYQWMQADLQDSITGRPIRIVITRADRNVADVVLPSGTVSCIYSDKLTPLQESPRMVWPDECESPTITNAGNQALKETL